MVPLVVLASVVRVSMEYGDGACSLSLSQSLQEGEGGYLQALQVGGSVGGEAESVGGVVQVGVIACVVVVVGGLKRLERWVAACVNGESFSMSTDILD
jgi:hypothetical protein